MNRPWPDQPPTGALRLSRVHFAQVDPPHTLTTAHSRHFLNAVKLRQTPCPARLDDTSGNDLKKAA